MDKRISERRQRRYQEWHVSEIIQYLRVNNHNCQCSDRGTTCFPDRFLTSHVYIGFSQANLPWTAKKFSSTTLKTLYEPCEFENERLLAFVDDPDFGPKDGGYLDRGKLRYKPEIVEQSFLFTQLAERPEQQIPLLRCINVSILWWRIDQRPLVYLIEAFGLLPPAETLVDMVIYDSLEPSLE
jgi:hypothetical protein